MKRLPTKAQIREEMHLQIQDFVERGGEVQQVAQGISGRIDGKINHSTGFVERPRDSRTPVTEAVASIESRKKSKAPIPQKRLRRPRKKMLYDDFGEPLRWVWTDQ